MKSLKQIEGFKVNFAEKFYCALEFYLTRDRQKSPPSGGRKGILKLILTLSRLEGG